MHGLVLHRALVEDRHPQGNEDNEGVERFKRPVLPGGDFVHHPICGGAEEAPGHLQPVLVGEEALNLPQRHASCAHGEDSPVEDVAVALALLDELRVEGSQPFAWDGQLLRPILDDHLLGTSSRRGDCPRRQPPQAVSGPLLVAQMAIQLGMQHIFYQPLGKLVEGFDGTEDVLSVLDS